MPVTGRSFGQQRPPLTDLLKNILERYPDGGQILKELIQNADDAGAHEVKVLFDAKSHGRTSLVSPELALFQGPALYCYNDAVFTDEDWEGLQRLMRSNKENNPLKVGRFGIGFNSVYHITDLPSIASGNTVAFLDPHEKYFIRGEPGRAFSTQDPLLAEHPDQFEPFHQLFGCNLNQGNYYQGTLFRFPLRTQPSQLSNKIYTRDMVYTLFDSLKNESIAILMFLKKVDSISLYERGNGGKIVHLYTAKVSENSKNRVRERRQQLIKEITMDWDFSVKTTFYRMEIEKVCPGQTSEKSEWFLANQVGSSETRLNELAKSLKLLPWIGIAFPLDVNHNMSSLGRIFCFLPLPPDGDCRTGLPVQVNGYFGLTDNRRALKWPGPDCQNDETAEWNQLLLEKVGSQVYASLIINLVQYVSINVPTEVHAKLVYSAFPDLSHVRQDWKCMLQPFFEIALAKEIFFTTAKGNPRWINLGKAILDRLDETKENENKLRKVVLRTLLSAGQPVVSLPRHILEIIDQYHHLSVWKDLKKVTPSLLCEVLRSDFDFQQLEMTFQDRLLLLKYALQNIPESISDLHGVALLPLENRQFIKFSVPAAEKIFIPSQKHSADLLPNMKHRLLHCNIPSEVQQKLEELGYCETTQLKHPTADDIKQLLWENFPKDWTCLQLETVSWNPDVDGHPSLTWLELVWKWINENYPTNLSDFEGMPLLPVSINSPSSMARLGQNSTIIVTEHLSCNETLAVVVRELLERSGCVVVEKLPSYLQHNQILNYISLPNPSGILNVLLAAKKTVARQLSVSSNEVKRELCSVLSRLDSFNLNQISFIRTLPIFEVVNESDFVSCESEPNKQRLVAPQNVSLPKEVGIVDRTQILSSSKDENYRLLKKLGMRIESTASLIMIHLESFLNSGIKDEEKDNLMVWILEKIDILVEEMPEFLEFVRHIPCIPTASGKRIPPTKLFDDSDEILTSLIQGNSEAFPTNQFSEPLRKRKNDLKVRQKENLTANDVFSVISGSSEIFSAEQSMALLQLMDQRPQLLTERTAKGKKLADILRDFPWFPRVQDPPTNYPEVMPWYDGMRMCKPSDMYPESLAIVVGAVAPIFDSKLISDEVQDLLGMSLQHTALNEVFKQLQLAAVSWKDKNTTPLTLAKFEEMIKNIYIYLKKIPKEHMNHLLQTTGLTDWIWYGNGFTSPENVALESHFPKSINLQPYLFCLPIQLFEVKEFLLGHSVKLQFNVDDLLNMLWCIKQKHDAKQQPPDDVTQEFDQCRAVLEWIVRNGGDLSEERRGKLLIPVQCQPGKLQLEPCNKCTYCDREFLRRGVSEHQISFKSHLIHKAIPDDLASHLQVPRLSSCLVGAKSIGIKFKEAGQYEPLTTRLRNILQQYKEGVAIFKEIIQNADDARASKVCFVVDWRENPRERLLTEELAECQGPALWAYNDAMFSDNDFENINKLAGETKKEDLDKVGRFGLGFNSVYHLTDVPSIVSGEHMVILDPNMTHISELVDGKMRRGGVMLSLLENKDNLSAFPDQFSPYNNLFGCDMSGASNFHFNGTLFRLPFRTAKQAHKSEVSKETYSRDKLNSLMKSLKESAATVLLFSQNVQEVHVFEIAKSCKPETSLERPLICIRKSVEKILHTNDADRSGEGTILQNSSAWLLKSRESKMVCESEGPRRTELLKIDISMAKSELYEVSKVVQEEDRWIVNSCAGTKSSLQVAQSDEGVTNAVVPIAGVAVKMTQSKKHGTKIIPVTGEVFCFMPLSIESGFPMHVNGSFSLYPSRRRLWEEGVGENDSLKPFEARWNEALMEDALAQSYLQLLEIFTSFKDKKYEFHNLWPNPTMVNYPKAWKPFLISFFNQIIDEEWPLFYCNKKWRTLHDCLILDPKLNKIDECVTIMNQLGKNVLSLPQNFIEAFNSSGKGDFIESHMLTEDKFLREFFFPEVSKMPSQLRDSVLVYVLDRRLSKHLEYDDLLLSHPSFSCSRDGQFLRKPNDLVHPNGRAACLFAAEEMRFPVDERLLERERSLMLEKLGMVVDFLSWSALCERVQWVSDRCDVQKARLLIEYMNTMPKECDISDEETKIIRAAQFLPILLKPKDYPFAWKSHATQLAAADQLYPERHKYVVGSFQLILKESPGGSNVPNESLQNILGLSSKQPELSDVFAQFDQVIKSSHLLTKEMKETVCLNIYDFLQKILSSKKFASQMPYLREQLKCRPWMVVRGHMVDPKLVARNWNKEDGSPYLFALPEAYKAKFKELIDWYGVKETFCEEDFIEAITKLRKDVGDKKLKESRIRTLIVLLEHLFKLPDTKPEISLPLPSVDGHLCDADKLVINQTPWLETDESSKSVHEIVPPMLAYKCGAKELRDADLTRYSEPIGQPFGQHEKLTDRLRNILKAYPADVGILKELLQNADDAGAEEIHFVYDPRTHGSKYIFSDKWKDLQGPAICVYNDKPFSKEDIDGIQRLGIGSKVDDPLKTGQYGIGFNAVYHLTDCPYFISNDEVICVSDPHKAYIAGASDEKPGRLFPQLDEQFRKNYRDVLSGFLGGHFNLKGSTMFRFPLRHDAKLQHTISKNQWNDGKVKKLFGLFRAFAKEMLLFLSNVTKISISVIKKEKLETYSVTCEVSDIGKRTEFHELIRRSSQIPTEQIQRKQISYLMKICDSRNLKKDWLVTQSLGYVNEGGDQKIPNGEKIGLLPRAGVAVLLSSTESQRTSSRHSIFCILPLPISTKFPAHINGHFALDSARRGLWRDPRGVDERFLWNDFLKRCVIAPTYASAIYKAKEYIPDYQAESNSTGTFPSSKTCEKGLKWYHRLFPCISYLDAAWKPVGEALYKKFLPMLSALPVAMPVYENQKYRNEKSCSDAKADADKTRVNVTWCKVSDVYFCVPGMSLSLEKTLLHVGFHLLSHTPKEIHKSFKAVQCNQDVGPEQVLEYLQIYGEMKDDLPKDVTETVFHEVNDVVELTRYCANAGNFFENLDGLPLLLTQDGKLRCFRDGAVVFCSKFSQLLSSKPDLFLHELLTDLYEIRMDKCADVMREFLISDLANYQDTLFPPSWINSTSHQPWNPDEEDDPFPTKEWLILLWKFIDITTRGDRTHSEDEIKVNRILKEIVNWHIVPTSDNCLVPLSTSKTVLNVSTYTLSVSSQDEKRQQLLIKIGCPQLNYDLLKPSFYKLSSSVGAGAVCQHYLAMVQSTEDVLRLLDQTMNGDTEKEATLDDREIEELLMFLQGDLSKLSFDLLRNLPFYQTIIGTHTRISPSNAVYEVSASIPGDDLELLSTLTSSTFLRQTPKLEELYQYIGIEPPSDMEFYKRIVLKNFKNLSPQGMENHLKYIRDHLLNCPGEGYEVLLSIMKRLHFIPDVSGDLRAAKEFFDPHNEEFKDFVPQEKFLPTPFDSAEWQEFLKKIGLQCSITEEHFLQFAKQLEQKASNFDDATLDEAKIILQKSNMLISHLFKNNKLHTRKFLSKVSKINFVPVSNLKEFYLDIYPSPTKSIVTCFNGSVIGTQASLVWSTASLIANSAVPDREDLIKMLGIHVKPPHELFTLHVKNISSRFAEAKEHEIPANLQTIFSDVMMKIYNHFKESCKKRNGLADQNCSPECQSTSEKLRDAPVILVDRHTLVCGSQLAFRGVWDSVKPYMFNIPRHLQHFEHFLKCIGAQEYPTPLQCSSVLEKIKGNCGNGPLHPAENSAAIGATKYLFKRLSKDMKLLQAGSDSTKNPLQSLANVQFLYLPTQGGHLKQSCSVFVNDTMENKDRLKDYWEDLLIDLTMKNQDPPAKLVELLPKQLKVKKLSAKLNEELSPSCIEKFCVLDRDPATSSCEFIRRYRNIICSPEFSEALIRLYKYQEKTGSVPEEVKNNLRRLEDGVEISCMRTIEIHLVEKATMQPVQGSEAEVSAFFQEKADGARILIKHGGETNRGILHERLSSFIYKITGQHVRESTWRYLMMILGVKDSSEISKTLDGARVQRSISDSSKDENPGEEIAEHFHYLLKNDVNYNLREGELVGYEIQEESEESGTVYVYAKIIEQTNQGDGRFSFNSTYKIDIGDEGPLEVSKLKLYKFDRKGRAEETAVSSQHEKMDLMPFEGNETGSSSQNSEPVNLEEAKNEVAEALREIWQLSESERSSAIKRLIRQWHPDKNRQRKSLANEVTIFLLNEVKRLKAPLSVVDFSRRGKPGYHSDDHNLHQSSRGSGPSRPRNTWECPDFSAFFDRYEERSRRQRQRQHRRQHCHHDWENESEDEPPNRMEGERWMRQAQDDFSSASKLFQSEERTYFSLICFLCQQAVEKSLKAFMFAKGGIRMSDLEVHDVLGLAYRAMDMDQRLCAIPETVKTIHGSYTKTRYPEYRRGLSQASIPAEMYTSDDARDALLNAEQCLQLLQEAMD